MTDKDYEKDEYCPICGNPLVIEDGLPVCYYCGWYDDLVPSDEDKNVSDI